MTKWVIIGGILFFIFLGIVAIWYSDKNKEINKLYQNFINNSQSTKN